MTYTLKSPDNPEVQDYLFSGENIILSPVIDSSHIEETINNLPEDIVKNGIFALGPALGNYPRKEHGPPGIPENNYNMGLLGIYVPPEFVDQLGREEPPLWLPLKIREHPIENYIGAAQHVISGYNENAVK